MLKIGYSKLKPFALAYISLPMMVFFIGFLKFYLAVPACLAVLYGYYAAVFKKDGNIQKPEKYIIVSVKTLVVLAFLSLFWCYLGGLNGFFFQSADWPWRNAIYRDIVFGKWPVIYENKSTALVYYIAFWLIPALPAKLTLAITGSEKLTWFVARQALWIFAAIGVFLVFLLIASLVRAKNKKQIYLLVLMFVFFSGMDILGSAATHNIHNNFNIDVMHLEWWGGDLQYSSQTTQLYWVFNQAIIPWIAVFCFLSEDTPKNYLLIGTACFASGPLPFIGLVVLMIARFVIGLISAIKEKSTAQHIKNAFSLQNIIVLIAAFLPFAAYYLCNLTLGSSGGSKYSYIIEPTFENIKRWILFSVVDFGVYALLLLRKNRKDPMFYVVGVSLLLISLFKIGDTRDFCMRVSIPALLLLFIYCANQIFTLFENKKDTANRVCSIVLVLALVLGAITPALEIYRGVYHCAKSKTVRLAREEFRSIGDLELAGNFTAEDYKSTLFFKYFAK